MSDNILDISPEEFRSRWDGDNESWIRFPVSILSTYGVNLHDCEFQRASGIPPWAAPNMNFFFEAGEDLPRPEDEDGAALPGDTEAFGQIGSTGENYPICLRRGGTGEILVLRSTLPLSFDLMNSSFHQLLCTLLAFNEIIAKAIAYGEAHGEPDAWRRGRYPAKLNEELRIRIQCIDQNAMTADSYWSTYLRDKHMF